MDHLPKWLITQANPPAWLHGKDNISAYNTYDLTCKPAKPLF
jgi:hypothetical protein